jgi:hypothetical protein
MTLGVVVAIAVGAFQFAYNDRADSLLQKRIDEKAQMAVLLSQLQSLRHQTAASVINNIR